MKDGLLINSSANYASSHPRLAETRMHGSFSDQIKLFAVSSKEGPAITPDEHVPQNPSVVVESARARAQKKKKKNHAALIFESRTVRKMLILQAQLR